MVESSEPTISQLRWRCRRGMRELDTLMTAWLKNCWEDADSDARQGFMRLLDSEDDALWDWMTGRDAPEDPALRAAVARVVERRP